MQVGSRNASRSWFLPGEPVREGSTTRPVRYEDCCILLAARTEFPAYVEALTARGIPVYADARENLMLAPHIRPLIALLKVIDDPSQDILSGRRHAGTYVRLYRG